MDEADIYYVDTRNADPVVISRSYGNGTVQGTPVRSINGRPPRMIYPHGVQGTRYSSTYGSPYMVGSVAALGAMGGMFGGMTGGQLVDLIAQVFAAVMPLPAAPTATSDPATDVPNLIVYQGALAQYAKRDEQIRTLGNLVTKLLGYEARHYDEQLFVPVYAAQSGEVALAGETTSGVMLTIDHGYREWATHYAHLSRLFVTPYLGQKSRRRQRVRGGDVIGYAAKSPIHVRFELWNWTDKDGFVPVDPLALMTSWGLARPPSLQAEARQEAA